MKIFIWNKDFLTDWTSGMAVVIAETKEKARQRLWKKLKAKGFDYDIYKYQVYNGPDETHPLKSSAFWVCGGS
jgi:hypothetical protein